MDYEEFLRQWQLLESKHLSTFNVDELEYLAEAITTDLEQALDAAKDKIT